MTKKELIEALEQFPDDYEIIVRVDAGEDGITAIERVYDGAWDEEPEQECIIIETCF